MNYLPLLHFMDKRHQIYLSRKHGNSGPWTKDPILSKFKFTNVYRELDRVTIWVKQHIREPFAQHENLWLMLCAARQINYPGSLNDLMLGRNTWFDGSRWDCERAIKIMDDRRSRKEQVFTGAYIVTNGGISEPKTRVVLERYIKPLWENRKAISTRMFGSMEDAQDTLTGYMGWGGFMAYEVICDLRYTRYLKNAPDKLTWAHAGPGARRGLARLTGKIPAPKLAVEQMRDLLWKINPLWPHEPRLEMREVEHSLCEFDKYERVRLGEGRPRSLFKPQDEGRLP